MRHFFNRRLSNSNSIARLLALAATATGTGLLFINNNKDTKTTISLSIPHTLLLQEEKHLWWSGCKNLSFIDLVRPNNYPTFTGQIPLISSSVSSVSPASKDDSGESEKHSCGCMRRDTLANAAALAAPVVVHLSVKLGWREGIGSGTIIDSDGTILTCAHCVADIHGRRAVRDAKVNVTLQDGRTFEGTVLHVDFHSDVAVVKIKSETPLPMAKLGSSSRLRPGDWVLSMGCPLSLQNTVTTGCVSAHVNELAPEPGDGWGFSNHGWTTHEGVDEVLATGFVEVMELAKLVSGNNSSTIVVALVDSCVDRKSSDLGLGGMRREYLQTDCAINQGNSGGPLVNLDGEVVGVNTMQILAANGLGFAVPIDSIFKILEQFKRHGRVVRPWLGLKMLDLNELIIAQLKERNSTFPDVDGGVLVPMVTPLSPASRAGFLSGDVVIEFEGKPIKSIKEIIEIMGDKIGKPLKVVVKRENNTVVTLIVVPEEGYPDM